MVRLGDVYRGITDTVRDPFSADLTGLPGANGTEVVELRDGESLDLTAVMVKSSRLADEVRRNVGSRRRN